VTCVRPLVVLTALAAVAVPALSPAVGAGQDPVKPTFRSSAAAVAVDVTVQDRSRRVVTGLTAADFQVFDNGVLQQVDEVSYGKLPIDVTVALDVSYSVTGALLERLRQGVVELMRDLGRDDRLKLVLFNMRVTRTTGFSRDVAAVERAIRSAKAGGGTALLDAVSVTLVGAADPDRRQLIVFFTDGSDNSSTTTADAVTAVARRTRATLAFVVPGMTRTQSVFTRSYGGVPLPPTVTRATSPASLPPVLTALAADTGGSVLPVGLSTDLSSTFRRVLGDFRSTYVLYFTPRGVEGAGYHQLEVKVTREEVQVHARRGYFGS
jgi:VWFA-related protein